MLFGRIPNVTATSDLTVRFQNLSKAKRFFREGSLLEETFE
jgi:hypothetical protein